MSNWLGEYLNSDLAAAERQHEDTLYNQNRAMSDLIFDLGQILGVPTAPAGVNGLFRREDFIARARYLAATVERIRTSVLHHEKEYMWTWDADTWTDADMGHSAAMIGDFLAILDEEAIPADLEDYMAEEQRRVALTMPLEAALADAHVEEDVS